MEIIPTKKSFYHYLFFWTGQIFSLLGSLVVYFVIMWWLTVTTNDPMILSLATFFFYLPYIFVAPIAGVFSDRMSRKKLIIIVDSLQAMATVLLIFLMSLGITFVWIIFIFIAFRSACQAFHQPTVNSITPTMVPKEKLSRINGLNFLLSSFVQLAVPAIAAILLLYFPVYQTLWIDFITFLIALVPLLLIKIPNVKDINNKESEKSSFIEEFKEGFRILISINGILVLVIVSMLVNFLIQPLNVLAPYFIKTIHSGTVVDYALVSISIQVGLIIGSILTVVKKQWKHKIQVMFSGIAIFLIGYVMLSLAPFQAFYFIGAILVMMGLNIPVINTIYQTIIQTTIPMEKLGRVSSIDSTLSMLISPVGSVLVGPLTLLLGVNNLFLVSAFLGLTIITAGYFLTGIRKVKFDSDLKTEIVDLLT
ncbi:MAG: MFS transporter [Promethearchaeota archaeon]